MVRWLIEVAGRWPGGRRPSPRRRRSGRRRTVVPWVIVQRRRSRRRRRRRARGPTRRSSSAKSGPGSSPGGRTGMRHGRRRLPASPTVDRRPGRRAAACRHGPAATRRPSGRSDCTKSSALVSSTSSISSRRSSSSALIFSPGSDVAGASSTSSSCFGRGRLASSALVLPCDSVHFASAHDPSRSSSSAGGVALVRQGTDVGLGSARAVPSSAPGAAGRRRCRTPASPSWRPRCRRPSAAGTCPGSRPGCRRAARSMAALDLVVGRSAARARPGRPATSRAAGRGTAGPWPRGGGRPSGRSWRSR